MLKTMVKNAIFVPAHPLRTRLLMAPTFANPTEPRRYLSASEPRSGCRESQSVFEVISIDGF